MYFNRLAALPHFEPQLMRLVVTCELVAHGRVGFLHRLAVDAIEPADDLAFAHILVDDDQRPAAVGQRERDVEGAAEHDGFNAQRQAVITLRPRGHVYHARGSLRLIADAAEQQTILATPASVADAVVGQLDVGEQIERLTRA
jgi:hypothetical protein